MTSQIKTKDDLHLPLNQINKCKRGGEGERGTDRSERKIQWDVSNFLGLSMLR